MRGLGRFVIAGLVALAAVVAPGDPAPAVPPPQEAPPAAAPAAPPPAGDIEDFVPSEKVSADDAVAFPVDI